MIKPIPRKQREQQRLQHQLLSTLLRLSPPAISSTYPPETEWCSTRQLADAHNISIYKARILLLGMVKNGEVVVAPQRVNNTLRWYPSYHRTLQGLAIRDLSEYVNKMAPS